MQATTTLTTNQAAGVGAVLGGAIGMFGALSIAFVILLIVAMWKIFTKAGEKGWKSLIPIYNIYIYFKIAGMKNWFWALFLVEVVIVIWSGIVTGNGMVVTDSAGNITEVVDQTGFAIFGAVVGIAAIFELVVGIMQCAKLSKAFGRGFGTTLGLIFLPNIFQLILAFGSAKYDKKFLKK